MPAPKSPAVLEGERIYEQYVKPLEALHPDEYALVTPDGTVFFAPSVIEVMEMAYDVRNPKNRIFKVGDIVVYRL